jgi:hypothetical protein
MRRAAVSEASRRHCLVAIFKKINAMRIVLNDEKYSDNEGL